MKAAGLPEMSVPIYQIVRRHILKAINLPARKYNILHSANLISNTIQIKTFIIILITTRSSRNILSAGP
jgi:hypothetical protein